MDSAAKPRSDLGIRTLSGVVMLGVAGLAVWLGGWAFTLFVLAVGAGVIWEWWGLARLIARTPFAAALWLAAGVSYVGIAMAVLVWAREQSATMALVPIMLVIAVDVGAYFAGRTIGGPKIAPRISPSKTWAGLFGGAVAAFIVFLSAGLYFDAHQLTNMAGLSAADVQTLLMSQLPQLMLYAAATGLLGAIIAQAGDFFESWMKRRAGVKDSGNLIPGHGGLFDRVDGLLAVLLVGGIMQWMFWGL